MYGNVELVISRYVKYVDLYLLKVNLVYTHKERKNHKNVYFNP